MIVVVTVPGRDYLIETLKGIDLSAKDKNKIILCDGINLSLNYSTDWKLIYFKKPRISPHVDWPANKYSMWYALKLAVESNEDLLFFEDDLIFSKDAVNLIENFFVPHDLAWVSFFSSFGTKAMPEHLMRLPGKTYLFSQAIKFPLKTCKLLHNQHDEMLHNFRRGGSDEILASMGHSLNLTYGIFFPSLVQHVGQKSIVGNGELTDFRTSQSFRGINFDVKNLRAEDYK